MALELANLALALYLTGVVWMVQVVHYPLFALVGEAQWAGYEERHRRGMGIVVGPAMVASVLVAAVLVVRDHDGLTIANAVLALAPFVATFAVFVPLHDVLTRGWDAGAHRALTRRNWLRTVLWTAQAAVALAIVA